ncbi:MAG: 16S rRNA (uracil(1498)-N(3))-methyltransferase [Bacteroidales bacterium]|nr:16S rRNA (uracil(1498)-N(3))-methyltransferase [Bacteroidales bacterium]
MELFHSNMCDGAFVTLDREESRHCVKVLRHVAGDRVKVIDGKGTLLDCTLVDASDKGASLRVESRTENWGSHPYRLSMGVCPTKNADRFEWFAEKACELGTDSITPLWGDHSERRVFKAERLERILVAAAKQSLKAAVPQVGEPAGVRAFAAAAPEDAVKLIAYCFEDGNCPRISVAAALEEALGTAAPNAVYTDGGENVSYSSADKPEIVILIGPEGDFSREEAEFAVARGFRPVHLGSSRLRTETAALTAVEAVYLHFNH